MGQWYRTGTVAVTNGSPNVVGTGTLWLTQTSVGDIFVGPDLLNYEITSITDDTHMAVKKLDGTAAYNGASLSAQAYAVIRNFTSTLPAQLASQLAAMMAAWHVTTDELTAWLSGTGSVTVHDAVGNAYSVQTPSALNALFNGRLSKSVAGNVDVVLTATEANNLFIELTGALTGNINVIVPAAARSYFIYNASTGAYTITIKTAGGTGVVVPQDGRNLLECDGTNVINPLVQQPLMQPALTLKQSASAAPTAEGVIEWDTDDNKLKIGDGAATRSFSDDSVTGGIHGVSGSIVGTSDVQTLTNKEIIGKGISLDVIDQTVFASITLVDVCLYDTSKDSDGGAWRQRCGHTSWEAEALCGNWLGSAANEAAARAISGATTGSYYYDTTAGVFYKLNAGAGVTQVYRGNVAKFPARVLITVEAARVVLWDLTQAGAPMWMVAVSGGSFFYENTIAAVVAENASVVIACSPYDLYIVNFIKDTSTEHNTGNRNVRGNIALRNGTTYLISSESAGAIVDRYCNDVAMTVLPNAPVDVATGLPVPTIAVATNGGVSVITHDGDVWDLTFGSYVMGRVFFTQNAEVGFCADGAAPGLFSVSIYKAGVPSADDATNVTSGSVYRYYEARQVGSPALVTLGASASGDAAAAVFASDMQAIAGSAGLTLIRENPATPGSGMVAYLTKDYTSGWLLGAIKGAWLADTVAETITGSELVTNGDFATDATGWTALNGAGLSVASGELTITNAGSTQGGATRAFATVVGKTYTAACTARKGTCANANLAVGTTSGGVDLGAAQTTSGTNVTLSKTFVATATTTYISGLNESTADGTCIYDNLSCRLADVDRSVKAKGLQVFGSLTKAAVASGAQLMGYSGFSAANFAEQPYNADLDFGTGDFCIMGWVKQTAGQGDLQAILSRGSWSGSWNGALIWLSINASGTMTALISDDGLVTNDAITSAVAINDSVPRLFALVRRSGYLELWLNDAKAASDVAVTNAAGSLSNTSATLRIARRQDTTPGSEYPLGNGTLSLLRAATYAPTAEQIAHIYATEKALFEANAQCCLAGSSSAVTALAYDDETDLLHVGTSYGRSAFKGLVRIASEATPVGAITALAAGGGVVAQAGASGADVYVPAYSLREELLRAAEQAARFGAPLVAHDFTATASQTTFTLPVGWEIVAVYSQGGLKRETTSWTRSFDGIRWSVVLGTGATVSDWISILARRV